MVICTIRRYIRNVLVGSDQLLNAILGGDPDETISSRAGKRVKSSRVAYWLCRCLHFLEPDHCKKSIESDEGSDAIL